MKQIKQKIKIVLLFAVLLSIICTPLLYMEYRYDHITDQTLISSISHVRETNTDQTAPSYNIWERLKIIKDDTVQIRVTELTEFNKQIDTKNIWQNMEEQLTKLYQYHAIPALMFSDPLQISVSKNTYIPLSSDQGSANTVNLNLTISVWEICAEYRDFYLYAYMDTENSALYDITLQSKNTDFLCRDLLATGFLEYLLDISEFPNERDEWFSANASYTKRKISLYLMSVNRYTSQYTFYRFHSADTNLIVEYSDAYTQYGEKSIANDTTMIHP